jgi:hypothetical protein
MRNFLQIASGIDSTAILVALAARPELWNEHDLRTTYPDSPHADVDDIWLLFNETGEPGDVVNDIQTHPYDAWYQLPVRDLILDIMRRVGGIQLGRAIITRLAPGCSIGEHVDQGAPAEFYSRYHVILQSTPGCITRSGEEVIQASPGEVWWFNNREPHSVTNNGSDDRIVIVVDIRVC